MFAEVLRSEDGHVLWADSRAKAGGWKCVVCRQQSQSDEVQFEVGIVPMLFQFWIGIVPMLFLYHTPGAANLVQ